jgi:hypothetical protein
LESKPRKQEEEDAFSLLDLYFEPENGGSTFLRNVRTFIVDYKASHSTNRTINVTIVCRFMTSPNCLCVPLPITCECLLETSSLKEGAVGEQQHESQTIRNKGWASFKPEELLEASVSRQILNL